MTLRNNSGTGPSSPNPPAVVYRDVAVAGGAPLPPLPYTLCFIISFNFTLVSNTGQSKIQRRVKYREDQNTKKGKIQRRVK